VDPTTSPSLQHNRVGRVLAATPSSPALAASRRSRSVPARPIAIASTAAATVRSTPPFTASPSPGLAATARPAPTSTANGPKPKPTATLTTASNATSPAAPGTCSSRPTPDQDTHTHQFLDIDGMCRAPSWRMCRDLLTSSAGLVRAGVQAVELGEAPSDDRNGTRSASSAYHRRVARHVDRRDVAQTDRAGRSCRAAPVRRRCPWPRARGSAGSDHRLALRRRGAPSGRRSGASGRAGRDGCAAGDQEARQKRSRRRPPSARASDGRAAAGVVDPTATTASRGAAG
jgi:hypothetical protein